MGAFQRVVALCATCACVLGAADARAQPAEYVFIADQLANKVFVAPVAGGPKWVFADTTDGLADPIGLAFGGGHLYVANYASFGTVKIVRLDMNGQGTVFAEANDGISHPTFLTFNENDGYLYVADEGGNAVRRIDAAGTTTTYLPGLSFPEGLAIDPASGDLFVGHFSQNAILRVTAQNTHSVFATKAGGLSQAFGLAFDASGNLFVSDPANFGHTGDIWKFDAAGNYTSVANTGDGLDQPAGIAFDASGALYVANYTPNGAVLRLVFANGQVTASPFATGFVRPIGIAIAALDTPPASNQAPTADAGPDARAIVGETVAFDGSGSSDPDGSITSYTWSFGDETAGSGAFVTHDYAAPGLYTVSLTVTDNAGATDGDTAIVTVISVAEAIDELSAMVEGYNLARGITNSLDAKLVHALDALDAANAGVRSDAQAKLLAFVHEVEAQRDRQLTPAQADALGALARRILGAM